STPALLVVREVQPAPTPTPLAPAIAKSKFPLTGALPSVMLAEAAVEPADCTITGGVPGLGPPPTALMTPAAAVMVIPSTSTTPKTELLALGTVIAPALTVMIVPSGFTVPSVELVAALFPAGTTIVKTPVPATSVITLPAAPSAGGSVSAASAASVS